MPSLHAIKTTKGRYSCRGTLFRWVIRWLPPFSDKSWHEKWMCGGTKERERTLSTVCNNTNKLPFLTANQPLQTTESLTFLLFANLTHKWMFMWNRTPTPWTHSTALPNTQHSVVPDMVRAAGENLKADTEIEPDDAYRLHKRITTPDCTCVNGKTTSMLLCTCDTRGCTENKEFKLMEIESLGPLLQTTKFERGQRSWYKWSQIN